MPKVRFDPSKWANRAAASGSEYQSGAANPRRSQSASAIEAKDNYAMGVNSAIAEDRYAKGLQKSGDAKWQKGIREKGQQRYQQGVVGAQDEYRAGFQPYASALTGLELGPKGPKGQNYGRVQQVGEMLRAVKKGL